MAQSDIEQRFHQAMLRIYCECETFGYRPTRFLRMVNERGGLKTARRLLHADHLSDGFARLWEEQRLDLSVEAVVLREPWRRLFTEVELAIASRRLEDMGYFEGSAQAQ